MRVQKKTAIIVMVLLMGWTGWAWADVAATVNPDGITESFGPANSIGWRFFVDKEITITHLGLYDAGDNGLAGNHVMGIWRVKKEGGLRLERWVNIGPGDVTENHYVYKALDQSLTIVPDPEVGSSGYAERWLVGVWSPKPILPDTGEVRSVQPRTAATLAIEQADIIRFENYTYTDWEYTGTPPDTTLGDGIARYTPRWWCPWGHTEDTGLQHFGVNFKYTVPGAPTAEAGPDVQIYTSEQALIVGTAVHTNPTTSMQYRWLEGGTVLQDWTPVGLLGTANLDLAEVAAFSIGPHTLTLEVSDDVTDETRTVSDTMTLTVANSPPEAQLTPAHQVVQVNLDAIIITAEVADFDGDELSYQWLKGGQVLDSGTVTAPANGTAASVDDLVIAAGDPRFPLGVHEVQFEVSDGVNPAVTVTATVEVKDTTAPTLTPTASTTMLWPPNGMLRPVTIWANAFDNGGGLITLTVNVQSDEPTCGHCGRRCGKRCGHWAQADWYIDSIDNETGVIQLRLRAERLGRGDGRVYTITITATDQSSNQTSASVEVRVPHDRKKK